MTRSKLLDLFAGFGLVAAILAVDVLGRRWHVDDSTRTFALGSLALMLWQVRGWFGANGQPPSPPSLLVLALVLAASLVRCASPALAPIPPSDIACVIGRGAAELRCVDDHDMRAEIDRCRADVRARIDCADGGAL